ncbi:hypothetical protein AB0O01_11980 [Streptomyces sp. NPDC093252]|uniref:hypothetical protein n=1 Tax=Streptomyces sp. NPDC093252 TaxID=3154980 RepID=UPI003421A3B3
MTVLSPAAPADTVERGRPGGAARSWLWWPVVALPAALAALRSGEAAGHSPSDLFARSSGRSRPPVRARRCPRGL